MVLIVIAVAALYRWIRGLIRQHAANQRQHRGTVQVRISRWAEPAPPNSPNTPEPLVLAHIGTLPEQINERTDRHARPTPTSELVPAAQ